MMYKQKLNHGLLVISTLIVALLLLVPTNFIYTTDADTTNILENTYNQNNNHLSNQYSEIPQLKTTKLTNINYESTSDSPLTPAGFRYNTTKTIEATFCTPNHAVNPINITITSAGEQNPDPAYDHDMVNKSAASIILSTPLSEHGGVLAHSGQGSCESIYPSECFPSQAHGQTCTDYQVQATQQTMEITGSMSYHNFYAESYANDAPCGCVNDPGFTYAGIHGGFYVDENTLTGLILSIPFTIEQQGYLWIDEESFVKNDFYGDISSVEVLALITHDTTENVPCDWWHLSNPLWTPLLTEPGMITPASDQNPEWAGSGFGTNVRYYIVNHNNEGKPQDYRLFVYFKPHAGLETTARCHESQIKDVTYGSHQFRLVIHYSPLDLDIDSDNTNNHPDFGPDRTAVEENLEYPYPNLDKPGKYIIPNDDDDNANNIVDYQEYTNSAEDNFVRIVLEVPEMVFLMQHPDGSFPARIGFEYGGGIRLWKKNGNDPSRTQNDILDSLQRRYTLEELGFTRDNRVQNFWIENIYSYNSHHFPSPRIITAGIIIENSWCLELYDEVPCTLAPSIIVDLDVDSDNDNRYFEPERDGNEETLEMNGTGKLIWVHHEQMPWDGWHYITPYAFFDLFPLERSIGPGSILDSSNFYHGADVTLSQKGGSGTVTIYAPSGNLSQPWQIVPLGSPLQQEYFSEGGLQRKWYIVGEEPGQVILELKLRKSTPYYAHPIIVTDTVKLTVLKIEEVKWVETSISPLDGNPNAGGGLRIFPDKNTPNNQPKGLVKRTVGVLVTINPPLPNIMVYLKYFDVDDPKESRIPVDDESKSRDNRDIIAGFYSIRLRSFTSSQIQGNQDTVLYPNDISKTYDVLPTLFGSGSKLTNNTGEVFVDFAVSMQPGDNYRVVADLAEYAWINTLCVPQRTRYGEVHTRFGNNVSENQITELLTVWRRLWIERDSMMMPSFQQIAIQGVILSVTNNYLAVPGYSHVKMRFTADDISKAYDNVYQPFMEDNFEGGHLRIYGLQTDPTGFTEYTIIKSWSTIDQRIYSLGPYGTIELIIINPSSNIPNNTKAWIYEDEVFPVLPHFPNGGTALMNAFAQAYVLPIYWDEWSDYVPFERHLSGNAVHLGGGTWNSNADYTNGWGVSYNQPDCWCVFVCGAWESDIFEDADPDSYPTVSPWPFPFNLVPLPNGESATYGQGSIFYPEAAIFLQTITDTNTQNPIIRESHIVTHEIGHKFNSNILNEHEPNTIMDASAMTTSQNDKFGPYYLNQIRSTTKP